MGRVPERTCVACRRRAPRRDLVRIVLDAGRVRVDPQMTRPGRGAYLHPDPACIEAAAKRGALARALRASIGADEKRGALARALRASIGADEVSNLKGHIVGEEGR